jgi:hypothetical protein
MRYLVARALAIAVVGATTQTAVFAQCDSCQPPYEQAPYSGPYSIQTNLSSGHLQVLQLAANGAISAWTTQLNNRGENIDVYSGSGGFTIITVPNLNNDGVWQPTANRLLIREEILTDPAAPAGYLEALLLHEMGHVHGLGQAQGCSTSVMSNTNYSSFRTSFSACDQAHFDNYWVPGPNPCATDPGLPQCSPLLIDTEGDGFRLTAARRGVHFDINGDGRLEQVGWTASNTDDAWLAMDRNNNGIIDNGTELFGNVTPKFDDPCDTTPNGFEALKYLENEFYGNFVADGVIDRRDDAFWRLLLWYDRNHNGQSEPDELVPVSTTLLDAIPTTYRVVERRRRGNTIRQVSTVEWGDETRRIVDVWLAVY